MLPVPKAVARQAVCQPLTAPVGCSGRDHGSDGASRVGVAERGRALGGPDARRTARVDRG